MKQKPIYLMTEISMAVALAVVLSFLPLFKMPQGGSVSLQMLPIFIIALRRGGKAGLLAGLIFGLIKLAVDPYIVHPIQLIFDYPLPFMLLGLAGFIPVYKFKEKKQVYSLLFLAIFIGSLGRFLSHLTTGIVFFGHFAPEGQSPFIYSLIYNGSYLLPSFLITFLVLIPLYDKLCINQAQIRSQG